MPRKRDHNDGLPSRLYERRGTRDYSIGYKGSDGKWAFRLKCPANDRAAILELRRQAIKRAADMGVVKPTEGTFGVLCDTWLARQRAMPLKSPNRRAEVTLDENENELKNLKRAFGHLEVGELTKHDAYGYLDACLTATAPDGTPRPRPAKGNKEISLARTVLEYAVRIGTIKANPFDGVEPLKTVKTSHLVTSDELALAVEVGRKMGGPQHIVAMALRTAYLCVRRSVEVRAFTRGQIGEDGILWTAGKMQAGEAPRQALIEWTPALRETVDEALAIKRHNVAGTLYVFGNMSGQKYTKGGWKATLAKLMNECVAEAERKRVAFRPFSLQECRPMGVTAKKERGDQDVVDATLHTSDRMVNSTYDRRRVRVATPSE